MSKALGFLLARSLRNRARLTLRRLRRPSHALAVLAGIAYLAVVFGSGSSARGAAPVPGIALPVGALGLAVLVAWGWVAADAGRVLAFSPAEVAWLFPAPLTRRQLLHLKLARAQGVVLLNALLWTALTWRPGLGAAPWRRALAIWALLSVLALHRTAAALLRKGATSTGRAGLRRILPLAGLVLFAFALLAGLGGVAGGNVAAVAGPFAVLAEVLARPPFAALLWPFTLPLRPLFAGDPAAWLAAMGPVVLLLGAHYLWIVRADRAFEEAVAAHALDQLAQAPRGQSARPLPARGARAPLLPLAAARSPAAAIAWRHLASVTRRRGALLALGAWLLLIVAIAQAPAFTDLPVGETASGFALAWLALLAIVGPQLVRNDLREDLAHLSLLRVLPLRGRTIVGASAAASALVLAAGYLALAGVAAVGGARASLGLPALPAALYLLLAAPAALALALLQALVQNGGAILFPAWVRPARAGGGTAVLGTNLLTGVVSLALVAGLLLPVGLGVGAAWAGVTLAGGGAAPALCLAEAAGVLVALGEARLLAGWLGRRFERLEPGDVDPG